MARVTWRAAGYAANLARGRNNWPNDCKTKTPVPGGEVEVARAAQEIREVRAGEAHEAALEDLPGPVDSRNATVAFATRAGGARKERAGGA